VNILPAVAAAAAAARSKAVRAAASDVKFPEATVVVVFTTVDDAAAAVGTAGAFRCLNDVGSFSKANAAGSAAGCTFAVATTSVTPCPGLFTGTSDCDCACACACAFTADWICQCWANI